MKKNVGFLLLLLINCTSITRNYDFKYQSRLFSEKNIFEEVNYDSKLGEYKLKEKENFTNKFSIKTIQIKLNNIEKKEIYKLYKSLRPIKLYNCFYDTDNGEILEKTFISFYSKNNSIDSLKCNNFKENKKIQLLNTVILDKIKSKNEYRKVFYWEFIKK